MSECVGNICARRSSVKDGCLRSDGYRNYNADSLAEGKAACKAALQNVSSDQFSRHAILTGPPKPWLFRGCAIACGLMPSTEPPCCPEPEQHQCWCMCQAANTLQLLSRCAGSVTWPGHDKSLRR